jgi:hypothetical protein
MRTYWTVLLLGGAIASLAATDALSQTYPFYYGHNYGTHYVKDHNHDYWQDYSPDRKRYFGDPGYEAVDDPDVTNDSQDDQMARFKGYTYKDDGYGYRYRPREPLPRGSHKYAAPDRKDVFEVGVDLFEADYVGKDISSTTPRQLHIESRVAPGDTPPVSRRPRFRADRSLDRYGRHRL